MDQSSNETQNNVGHLVKDIAENPHPPRPKDLSYYLVLLFAVIPIWSVVPASWAFVIYSLRTGKIYTFAWKGRLYFAVALCEVRFLHRCPRPISASIQNVSSAGLL